MNDMHERKGGDEGSGPRAGRLGLSQPSKRNGLTVLLLVILVDEWRVRIVGEIVQRCG